MSHAEFAYLGWSTSLYAGIDDASRTAHVVFRGTDQLIDWAVNLACLPLPFDHPRAHGGFVAAWRLAKRRFMPWLREQSSRVDRVVIAGHSLGGALALVCAYELQREGFEVASCITIGAPRVYTARSVAEVERVMGDRLIRVCRAQDAVPKIPPEFLGFRHIGHPSVFIAEYFGHREPDPLPAVGQWMEKVWYYFTGGPIGEWLREHGLESAQAYIPLGALSLIATLGTFAVAIVEVSVLSLFGSTLLFLALSGIWVALAAHRSGHYAATHKAASLVEEWQNHCLRDLTAGQSHEAASEDTVWVDLSLSIRADHSDDHKRRLIRNFRRFFGAGTFKTELGRSLEESLRKDRAASRFGSGEAGPLEIFGRKVRGTARADNTHAPLKAQKLDLEFKRVCMSLLLHGYSSEEIDQMLDDGVIARPKNWSRYYTTLPKPDSPPPGMNQT